MSRAAVATTRPGRRTSTVDRVVAVVALLGSGIFAWFQTRPDAYEAIAGKEGELLVFAALLVVCEVRPVLIAREGGAREIVASTTFAFALLLAFGPAPMLVAQALASVVADIAGRKDLRRTVYDVAQHWVSWGIAAAALAFVSGSPHLPDGVPAGTELQALLVTAVAYFLCSNGLVAVIVNVHTGRAAIRAIAPTITREASSDWVLLALAPVVFAVADRSVALLPLLLLPVLAVYRSASISLEKEHQALHDALTDLPNRLHFNQRLDDALDDARRHGTAVAVLLIDLDRFKEINDTLGHQAGDELLQKIGPRILDAVPNGAVVARFGGDEFAVVLEDVRDAAHAATLAEQIVRALEQPFQVDDLRLDVEASIGIAMFPEHGADNDTLVQRADIAMYVAKGYHRAVELYDPNQDHHSLHRLSILTELRAALAGGAVEVHYQPKLDLRTDEVHAVEALLRWTHDDYGIVPPSDFVPLAEHTGLIRALTVHVLREAVCQARLWLDQGLELPIAVNLSARNLHDTQLPSDIRKLLDRHRVPARMLQLEITESSIMTEPGRARRVLETLHDMGIHIAIDDFGTGYSSLSYLQQLPVSEIKIDRSFVTGMLQNQANGVIVRSTIDLARNLGLHLTAEGVECEQTLDHLRAAGCDSAQGFFISRPLPASELERWVIARRLEAPADDDNVVLLPTRSAQAG
jgi:diguanylate cyclase (GGDEF)-like protein